MDHGGVASVVILTLRPGERGELFFRPAAIHPVGQWGEAVPVTQDGAWIVRAEGAVQGIFHCHLQVHHHALEEFLMRGDTNVTRSEDGLRQGGEAPVPRRVTRQFLDQG
jgi:hypothetical protein